MTIETELRGIKEQRNDSMAEIERRAIEFSINPPKRRDILGANAYINDLSRMISEGRISEIESGGAAVMHSILDLDMNTLNPSEQLEVHSQGGIASNAVVIMTPHDKDPEMPPLFASAMLKASSYTRVVPRNVDKTYAGANAGIFTKESVNLNGYQVSRELVFKIAVEKALNEQNKISSNLATVMQSEVRDPEFTIGLLHTSRSLAEINASMTKTNELVAQDGYFRKLITFLESYKVDGILYEHSGSQLAGMLAIDSALGIVKPEDFSKQDPNSLVDYGKYFSKNLGYANYDEEMQANIRTIVKASENGSVLDKILVADPSHITPDIIGAVRSLIRSVHTFRSVHGSSMERTFEERPDQVKYGSAGTMEAARFLRSRTVQTFKESEDYFSKLLF